jgi:glycosyltransferase involved in cell wall biosynthesis
MASSKESINPQITVVLCTFNGGHYLPEQLESIVLQSRLPAELVVCDDQSADNTISILQDFASGAPFPVRIFENQQRLGSTQNFDKAIGLARGDLITLCDQDDRWAPEKLEKLSEILIDDPFAGGVFSDANLIDENSRSVGVRLFAKHRFSTSKQQRFLNDPTSLLLKHDVVTGSTLMFRASLRVHCHPIPDSWVHDGWLAWMIALHSRIVLTTEALTDYRIHARQQLGVGGSRDGASQHPGAETRRQFYSRVANQFQDLLDHLIAHGWKRQDELVLKLCEKIGFLKQQSVLSTSLAIRLPQMIGLLPQYLRYARGLGSLRKDFMLGRELL